MGIKSIPCDYVFEYEADGKTEIVVMSITGKTANALYRAVVIEMPDAVLVEDKEEN